MTKRAKVPKVENLVVSPAMGRLSWSCAGKPVEVEVPELASAMIDDDAQNVFALRGADANSHPTELVGFSPMGAVLFKVGPPEGFIFSYLAHHVSVPISVVAMGDHVPGSLSDWHFSISPTGELKKVSYAY